MRSITTACTQYTGILSAVGAYIIWGILPIYWKLLDTVPAGQLLAHRVVWSFLFMIAIIVITKKVDTFCNECRVILSSRKKTAGVITAGILITLNWLIFIWAVNNNRIVETSLGYYINPLISVLAGLTFLKERLSLWQAVAVILASLAVLFMTYQLGSLPAVALLLAISFALYGLCKKVLNITAITSITLETMLASPFCLLYILFSENHGSGALHSGTPLINSLLIGAGIVSAIPLLLFSNGANRLPLKILGFLQYMAPTLSLFIGILVYHESFTTTHLISFSLIWVSLVVFSVSKTPPLVKLEAKLLNKQVAEQ